MYAKKIAIMQPYFFPYIGYFQLAGSVDEFVFLDDVNFIKKGFINRNKLLQNNTPKDFSIPVKNISQNRKISEHLYVGEFQKFLNLTKTCYTSAPNFTKIYGLIESILDTQFTSVTDINIRSIELIFNYLSISKSFSRSSLLPISNEYKSQMKIISICKHKKATAYHNPIGGQSLYDKELFLEHAIDLKFLTPRQLSYPQTGGAFISNLSIIDVLMWTPPRDVVTMIKSYDLT